MNELFYVFIFYTLNYILLKYVSSNSCVLFLLKINNGSVIHFFILNFNTKKYILYIENVRSIDSVHFWHFAQTHLFLAIFY